MQQMLRRCFCAGSGSAASLTDTLASLRAVQERFASSGRRERLEALQEQTADPQLWDDPRAATASLQLQGRLQREAEELDALDGRVQDAGAMLELLEEEGWAAAAAGGAGGTGDTGGAGGDSTDSTLAAMAAEAHTALRAAHAALREKEFELLMVGEHDRLDATVVINAGAGGDDAADWAAMLRRMYYRWAGHRGFDCDSSGSGGGGGGGGGAGAGAPAARQAGQLLVRGDWAYGWLRREAGVHRLVRHSPYDSSGKRHTSFASVVVLPHGAAPAGGGSDDGGGGGGDGGDGGAKFAEKASCGGRRRKSSSTLHQPDGKSPVEPAQAAVTAAAASLVTGEIPDADLRVDVFKSSGPGGQHANTTESAVRLTHLPTGTVTTCQSERSQHKNRAAALAALKRVLREAAAGVAARAREAAHEELGANAWGRQRRSWVLHPYTQVTDAVTGCKSSNPAALLEGGEEFDVFVRRVLAAS